MVSLFIIYGLNSLQKIANGPPKKPFAFSLLEGLLNDPLWNNHPLASSLQKDAWLPMLVQTLESNELTKKQKQARLALDLRWLASGGQESLDETINHKSIVPILEELAEFCKTIPLSEFRIFIKNFIQTTQTLSPELTRALLNTGKHNSLVLEKIQLFSTIAPPKNQILARISVLMPLLTVLQLQLLNHQEINTLERLLGMAELNLIKEKRFLSQLTGELDLSHYLSQFEQNPHGTRDLSTQFETNRILDVIDTIEVLTEDETTHLSYYDRLELVNQVYIVNDLGYSKAVPSPDGQQFFKPTHQLSLNELQQLVKAYKNYLNSDVSAKTRRGRPFSIISISKRGFIQNFRDQ